MEILCQQFVLHIVAVVIIMTLIMKINLVIKSAQQKLSVTIQNMALVHQLIGFVEVLIWAIQIILYQRHILLMYCIVFSLHGGALV